MTNYQFIQNLLDIWTKFISKTFTIQLFEVDFSKSWFEPIKNRAGKIILAFIGYGLEGAGFMLLPLVISFSFESQNYNLLAGYLGLVLVNQIMLVFVGEYVVAKVDYELVHSVELSGIKYFLTVDPNFHSTKSSGQIISKLGRGSSVYENLVDTFVFNLKTSIIGFLVLLSTFAFVDLTLSIIAIGGILLLMIVAVVMEWIFSEYYQPRIQKSEDDLKAISVENLQQATFVRSIFATQNQYTKSKNLTNRFATIKTVRWLTNGLVMRMLVSVYIIITVFIVTRLIQLVDTGTLSYIQAIGILSTFSLSTNSIIGIGHTIRRVGNAYQDINDLFKFIRNFGQQTFPVLEEDKNLKLPNKTITYDT